MFMFILCCNTLSFDWQMCAFVVLGSVFAHQAKRLALARGNVSEIKLPILCPVGRKSPTQSIRPTGSHSFVVIEQQQQLTLVAASARVLVE